MSSTNFTVPKGVKKIDCFCVGGGGEGGLGYYMSTNYDAGGGGGGGGYTNTVVGASVSPGQVIPIVVGAEKKYDYNTNNFGSSTTKIEGGFDGNTSSIGNICSAAGGRGGLSGEWANIIDFLEDRYGRRHGGNGGSGGGGGGQYTCFIYTDATAGAGGTNGNDGEIRHWVEWEDFTGPDLNTGGKGQGTTTRYFGESNGTLYASGGAGGYYTFPSALQGQPTAEPFFFSYTNLQFNSGNGGNGSKRHIDLTNNHQDSSKNNLTGSSGIAIIRWGK